MNSSGSLSQEASIVSYLAITNWLDEEDHTLTCIFIHPSKVAISRFLFSEWPLFKGWKLHRASYCFTHMCWAGRLWCDDVISSVKYIYPTACPHVQLCSNFSHFRKYFEHVFWYVVNEWSLAIWALLCGWGSSDCRELIKMVMIARLCTHTHTLTLPYTLYARHGHVNHGLFQTRVVIVVFWICPLHIVCLCMDF